MISDGIEIKNYTGAGYQPLIAFESWRIAVLRFLDELKPDKINSMERHTATDEVFILTLGKAMLVLGGSEPEVTNFQTVIMQTGEIYDVKKNNWHTIFLSEDAHVVIVENDDTSKENSETCILSEPLAMAIQVKGSAFLNKPSIDSSIEVKAF